MLHPTTSRSDSVIANITIMAVVVDSITVDITGTSVIATVATVIAALPLLPLRIWSIGYTDALRAALPRV